MFEVWNENATSSQEKHSEILAIFQFFVSEILNILGNNNKQPKFALDMRSYHTIDCLSEETQFSP